MKKIFIFLLLLFSIILIGCNKTEDTKTDYSLVYNSDGYYLNSFKLSDIKFKVKTKKSIEYVGLESNMLDKTYEFNEAGTYNITANYNDYRESVTFTLYDDAKLIDNSHNYYKKINNLYYEYSGSNLVDRTSITELPSVLYVGNTFGLDKDTKYESSDPSIARINENNVLICLKKGKVNIICNDDEKIKLNIEELDLTSDTYYSTIGYLPELNSEDIKTILHNLIDEHVEGSYSLLKTILKESDKDPKNDSRMILFYTGRSQGGENDIEDDDNCWTREQVWPLSKLGGDTNLVAGHDAHNVKPADITVHELRGNLNYGLGNTIIGDDYDAESSFSKISDEYFEPRDEVKGDAARILFYMAVRYEGDVNTEADLELVNINEEDNINYIDNLNLLLNWNEFDTVDSFEMNRNDVIYTYQRNRNPFIDHPTLANLIWAEELKPANEYEVIYNENGYALEDFKLSDIKISIFDGENTRIVDLNESMLVGTYDFSKGGRFNVSIRYENYEETIELFIIVPDPVFEEWAYKGKTEIYNSYSGNDLTDRIKLSDIDTNLYVGNTIGLTCSCTYTSSNVNVIKVNDNNVLVCRKKGTSTIRSSSGEEVTITVSELSLTAETYYSTIGYLPEMSSNDIKTILHNIIDEHVDGSYALLKEILPLSDQDPNNPNNMILLYTGRSQGGGIAQNNEPDGWNREHVWPLSKLGGDTKLTAGHDAHHIRPADVSVNADRGNLEYGIAYDIVNDTYAEGSSKCKKTGLYFEPRNEVKGDIARMLFYMAVRYEGDVTGEADLELVYDALSTSTYEFGNLALLLEWNRLDPVDEFEINRNNVIYTYQKNRNPFIDYPNLADLIWGNK